jgi:4-alpha-glucanotransferase
MASQSDPLERLAVRAGIMPSYRDVFDDERAADPRTLRALLAALGLDARDDAAVERTLARLDDDARGSMLEPVYVADAGRGVRIALRCEADEASATWSWDVRAEDATVTRGTFVPEALPLASAGERVLALEGAFPIGYHAVTVRSPRRTGTAALVVAPDRCWMPDAFERRGVWGLAVQLYGLRSERNWGIGDLTDLANLCRIVRDAGGAAVGVNPLHLVRPDESAVPSPYSPSSRVFANPLYLDVERLPGHDASDVDWAAVARAREPRLVDYRAVAALKDAAARAAFERFRGAGPSPLADAFAAFVRAGGETLRRAATFAALDARYGRDASGERVAWHAWPVALRDPSSPQSAAFAREHEAEIAYFAYLQWQFDEQLGACARVAPEPLGVYRDLAVGAERGGSDTWAFAGALVRDAAAGAPPDILNRRGQNWGVAPFDPLALRAAAYAPFVASLRANMRHAGALRIDHVMALLRLYSIPEGAPAAEGAYLAYRLDELLAIVALESVRARCLVIGEDLGTVPEGFREKLAARGVLSYRLLQFEVDDDGFRPPEAYPELALVSIGTHDLPPLGAYWTASDLRTRAELGLLPHPDAGERERAERDERREQLLETLAPFVPGDAAERERLRAAANRPNDRGTLAKLALAANRYLALTPGRVLMVQLEDLLGDTAQPNVPGTTNEHPNWRRRAAIALEELRDDPRFVALADALRAERGSVAGHGFVSSSSPSVPSLKSS